MSLDVGALLNALTSITSVFNSPFVSAAAGGLLAVFATQRLANRAALKADMRKEIRNTNAAIVLAVHVCNTYLNLKEQHVRELNDNFEQHFSDFTSFEEVRRQGQLLPGAKFELLADFRTLPSVPISATALHDLIVDRTSVVGRPLALLHVLSQSVLSLNEMLGRRNDIIASIKNGPPKPVSEIVPIYFGLPDANGHTDQTYPDFLRGIARQTDDCIQFSKYLQEDLVAHGRRQEQAYNLAFGEKAPTVTRVDWSGIEEKKLFPDESQYKNWVEMFVSVKEEPSRPILLRPIKFARWARHQAASWLRSRGNA